MAIEMVQENPTSPTTISPRISFSHYLCQKENYPFYCSDLNSDFDFCLVSNQTSSADEIFCDGFILPFKEKFVANSKHVSLITSKLQPLPPHQNKEISKDSKPRAFWGIKRSSSLHCHKRGSFWSFPLLSRSNSTGSLRNSKDGVKQSGGQFRHFKSSSSQKPPLRKSHGNGVRINPVINVTPPNCISVATVNLFGLGSLFRNGKDKKSGNK